MYIYIYIKYKIYRIYTIYKIYKIYTIYKIIYILYNLCILYILYILFLYICIYIYIHIYIYTRTRVCCPRGDQRRRLRAAPYGITQKRLRKQEMVLRNLKRLRDLSALDIRGSTYRPLFLDRMIIHV